MGAVRRWTPEEERAFADAWMSAMPTRDLVRMFRRYEPSLRLKAIKMGMPTSRRWAPAPQSASARQSVVDQVYPGPDGWYCTAGPPCLSCEYHEDKAERRECRQCRARRLWDAFTAYPELERRSLLGC